MAAVRRVDDPNMSQVQTLVMNSGGFRSLIATATAVADVGADHVGILFIQDGRPNTRRRQTAFEKQFKHFGVRTAPMLPLTHLYGLEQGRTEAGPIHGVIRPQILLAAGQTARSLRAETMIWPNSVNGDTADIAIATEQVIICDHLAQIEGLVMPSIDTPLLDLTDVQLVELAAQLDVPYELGYVCEHNDDIPCQQCGGCQRLRSAFDAANVMMI